MKKLKQILFILLGLCLGFGLLFTMGFVNKQQAQQQYKSVEVDVNQDDDLFFIDKKDVMQLLYNRGDSIVGKPKSKVNIPQIEKVLNSHEDVANAEVYTTIDCRLKIKVQQRKPVVRVFNLKGESYYIDEEGLLMPLSDKYTLNVLVANGNIFENYALHYKNAVTATRNDTLKKINMLDNIYSMAIYINADEFWKAQVQQLYINDNNEIELVPMAGNQKIIFGDTTDMDEKFKKLFIFYQQGLNTTGWWDKYSTINLKYKNQVVCTKKQILNNEKI